MKIDIEQRGFAGRFVDDVGIPDFLEECLRSHSRELCLRTNFLFNQKYRVFVKTRNRFVTA